MWIRAGCSDTGVRRRRRRRRHVSVNFFCGRDRILERVFGRVRVLARCLRLVEVDHRL